jgi:hypothetical protein
MKLKTNIFIIKNSSDLHFSFFWKIIPNINFDPRAGELIIPSKDEPSALALANLILINFSGQMSLQNILEKNFKFFTSLWVFENENVLLKIGNPWIKRFDCEKGVSVNFTNKDKNETHTGYVKIENLMSYATNYPLFENAIKIKKLLD